MATRITRVSATVAGSASGTALTGSPLTPPTGLKWTIVELRPTFEGAGQVDFYFDTELYHTVDSEDVNQYGKPQTVALDVVQPHQYRILGTDRSGSNNLIIVDIVYEESPQSGA